MKLDKYASARTKVVFNKYRNKWDLLDVELGISILEFDKPADARKAKRSWWFYLTADHQTSMKHLVYLENEL